jgi:integrase
MSALRDALDQYVAFRRAFGTTYREPPQTLGDFVDFLAREGAEFITTPLALRWAMTPQGVQHATWARRLSMVRLFAQWLSAIDPRTEVPPRRAIAARRQRNPPHMYSDAQIQQLLAAAAQLPSSKGLRGATYATLIGLLAATGLRPGEVRALDQSDVDLQSGLLTIRQSKFGKSRLVPMTASTCTALEAYRRRRNELAAQTPSEAFFISERGTRLQGCTVRRTFAKLTRTVGLRTVVEGRRIGRGPRLQDMRHSFATRTLIDWYKAGLEVAVELPKLATYLGHVDVGHTYGYIEAIPELLQLAAERLGTRVQGHRI